MAALLRALRFVVVMIGVLAFCLSGLLAQPAQGNTLVVCPSGCAYSTIKDAVDAASAGDTILVGEGTYVLSSASDQVSIPSAKSNLTIEAAGANKPILQVSGSVNIFRVLADNVTIRGLVIDKTDNVSQNIIYVQADGFTFMYNEVFGRFVHDTGEVSRGFEVAYGSVNLNISNNVFHHLRQPGYFNGDLTNPTTGIIANNLTYNTKGWVIGGANFSFADNQWGSGTEANVYDIAILSVTPAEYYTDIVAISEANNDAVIEDQRESPAVLSVAYVDVNSTYTPADGGRLHPYTSVQAGINRVVSGGKVYVATGTYASTTVNITKPLRLIGAERDTVILNVAANGGYGLNLTANDVQISGFTLTGSGGTFYGVKASGANNLLVDDLRVSGFARSGIDLIGCINSTVQNSHSHDNGGVGVAVSNSQNILLQYLTTNNNGWGGIGLFTNAVSYTGNLSDGKTGSDGIILGGGNVLGEINPLYTQLANASHVIRNFNQTMFDYVVRNTLSPLSTWYQYTLSDAFNFITAVDTASPGVKAFAGIQKLTDGSFHVLDTLKIQPAIDLAEADGVVYVYPGVYNETASNRYVLGTNGPHQFGLFIADNKDGIRVIGVDNLGNPITDYTQTAATINTNATNNFGYSGIFVEADRVTLQGLKIGPNSPLNNKTVEVIGDAFTLRYSRVIVPTGGAIYINDWRFNTGTQTSHVQSYTIDQNGFEFGTSVSISSGAGYSGSVANRKITNNVFTGGTGVNWALVSFNGYGEIPWFTHPIGAAVVNGNTFSGSTQYIRARSNYDNSQFDWRAYWNNNTFDKAVITLQNESTFQVRDYFYPSGSYNLTNVRRIGSVIAEGIAVANSGDTVLAKNTFTEGSVQVNKAVTVKGENYPVLINGSFEVIASNVTIDGFEIRNGAIDMVGELHGVYVSNQSGVTIRNNRLIGSWTGGESNYVGGRGVLTSGNVDDLVVERNQIEGWVSGLYLNSTSGSIVVRGNLIQHNWAGAGSDGQVNTTFRNNYFVENIEGIGTSDVDADLVVIENAFIDNTIGLKHYGGGMAVQGEKNWWNSAHGPRHSSHPAGDGQVVEGDVDVMPWLCEGNDTQPAEIGFQPASTAVTCPAAPVRLVFSQQPTTGYENIPFLPQPVVHAIDAYGNLTTSFNGTVFLSLGNNPAGGVLQGTLFSQAVNGVATFTGISINKAGQDYRLVAQTTSLEPAVGELFTIDPQNANLALTMSSSPNPVTAGATITYSMNIENLGPLTATGLTLRLELPNGAVFTSANGTGWSCSQVSGVVTCTRATLAAFSTAPSVTVLAQAPLQAGNAVAQAAITATTVDLDASNNQASASILVVVIPETGGSTLYLPMVKK